MQILEKKHAKNIKLFEESCRSEYTRKSYTASLNVFFQFASSKIIASTDAREIEKSVIDFVIAKKKEGKSYAAIHNYVSAICRYYKMNDVFLNTGKIRQYLPEFKKSRKDRAYEYEEIQKLLNVADDRMRVVILLLASTGMRKGAIPGLRLRNIEKISIDNNLSIYKITAYEGFKDEYVTFCSAECAKAIDEYLERRKRYGEKLTASCYLIREQFDVRDPFEISKCKETKANTITWKLINLAERAGIRQKEILVGDKKRSEVRKEVPIAHGFRKFFSSQMVDASPDVKTELRWLLEGHNLKGNDSHYVRTTDKKLLYEYEKALDNLTIDPANRLQKKVHKLEVENTQLQQIAADVALLKKKWKSR